MSRSTALKLAAAFLGPALLLPTAPATAAALASATATAAGSSGYVPVNGAGSTWSENALDQWRRDVAARGILINFAGTGSTDGRQEFIDGLTDFAVSEIPFQDQEHPTRAYAYLPMVAGGTALMYHLTEGGKRIDSLRLSPATVAKIFTGVITRWDDPLVEADNPGLTLPDEAITPVVRADSAGTTAQFTAWMAASETALWQSYCARVGLAEPCAGVSDYPFISGMRAQAGSLGVADYIAQPYGEGAIGYLETSYAQLEGYPVASVLNAGGYFAAPTAQAVAVALLQARINTDRASPGYLTQQLAGVYADPDPRAYPISSYSYLIVPTTTADGLSDAKGATLAAFGDYALCQGQADVVQLGYSPLPINLVRAGLAQLLRIPGARRQVISLPGCRNPTFSASGYNTLARTAPFPLPCTRQGRECGQPGSPAPPPSRARGPVGGSSPDGGRPPAGGQATIVAVPVTVPVAGGWTGTQTTMVVVFAVLIAVLLGPLGVAVARRRRSRASRLVRPRSPERPG